MSRDNPQDRSLALREYTERYCDGTLSAEQTAELERSLRDDPSALDAFVLYMEVHSRIAWNARAHAEDEHDRPPAVNEGRGAGGQRRGMAGLPAIDLPVGASVDLPVGAAVELPNQLEPRTPNPEPPFPSLSTTHYPLPTSHFSVDNPAFPYVAATVIMGVMLLVFWAMKVTHHQHIAESPSRSAPSEAMPEMVFVGRITGMVDVKWSDDPRYLPPPDFAHVPLERKYKLDAGLMEITYDTGAKVILQGPCTYEVESTAGGYLSLGKLTAKVEAVEGKGSRSKVQGPRPSLHPSSFILHPSSLFFVRTPTAVVTDLGTEFGVEVDESGITESHVFQGKVEVRLTGGEGEARAIQLGANESARVEPGSGRIDVVRRTAVQPNTFTRQMPKWVPIKLFSTGVGLKEGDEDPHWQIVARSDDPNFQLRPAVVTAAHAYWLMNYPTRAQWISTADGPPDVPDGVTYTFRTTFELAGALPETAVLRGRFIADNHVQAIRLNGKELPVPEHGWGRLGGGIFSDGDAFNLFSEFSARKGFVEGGNTLEIDVHNGIPPETGGNDAMGLRVELSGHVLSSWQSGGRSQTRGKEGTVMNGP